MTTDSFRLPSRYHSLELIARGGMADVYRATDAELGRDVAIKVLSERHADDQELRARFTREAQTAAGLSAEPGIVTIFDVGESDGRPYIVMELLTGGTIADRLRAGHVPAAQALAWLEQAARALDAAHAHGVIHRDVKPANLMLSGDGDLSVADFGIARAAALSSITSTGTIMGTSGYMSPEQARGGRATEASDRYALAVVAFELLTGRRPFVAESQAAEAAAHASAPVPNASSVNRELPAAVDAVLARGLAKEPAARHATCGELVWALRGAFQESTATTVRDTAAAQPVTYKSRRRVGVSALAAGLAVLGLLGAGALAAAVLTGAGDGGPEAVTLVRTQTVEGAERLRTVTIEEGNTVQATSPRTASESEPAASGEASGAELNDEAFRLMQAGDFESALPLLERAVEALQGSGELAEAYASYNLAFTRLSLSDCNGVVELLDRSEQVQGHRKEIDRLRKEVRKAAACRSDGGGDEDD